MFALLKSIREWWQTYRTRHITPEKVRERVQRGAAYLDDVDPEWYKHVDAETLELDDGRHCILGQMHGEFRLGLGRSHLISMSSAPRASLSPVAYGFKCVEGVPDEWQSYDYELLNEAWTEAVRERQHDGSPPPRGTRGDSVPESDLEVTSFLPTGA